MTHDVYLARAEEDVCRKIINDHLPAQETCPHCDGRGGPPEKQAHEGGKTMMRWIAMLAVIVAASGCGTLGQEYDRYEEDYYEEDWRAEYEEDVYRQRFLRTLRRNPAPGTRRYRRYR